MANETGQMKSLGGGALEDNRTMSEWKLLGRKRIFTV